MHFILRLIRFVRRFKRSLSLQHFKHSNDTYNKSTMKHFELLTVAFLGFFTPCDSFVIPLKHGRRLENSTILTTLIKSSLMMCHQSCLAREKCKSFQLDRQFNLCYLSSSDTSTPGTKLTIAPGLVYSEKKNWMETTLMKECLHNCAIDDTCTPTTQRMQCTRMECGDPQLMNSNSEIRGSMRNIGARVLHVCTNNPNIYNTSVCLPNGQWSNVSLTCPGACGNLPMIANGLFALDKPGFVSRGATATVQCNTGFEPSPKRSLQIKCLVSGLWESSKITCEPIDCGEVPSIAHGKYTLDKPGNTHYGARASLQCDNGYSASNQNAISCPNTGHWDNTGATCDPIDLLKNSSLSTMFGSSSYMILNNGNNKFWYFDFNLRVDKHSPVTVIHQPNNGYIRFSFELMTDQSYKIKNPTSSMYIGDGEGEIPCECLNGRANMDDEHKRFLINMETTGNYRIVSKATKRYVRVDEDLYVTSKHNKTDNFSLYTFIPAPA